MEDCDSPEAVGDAAGERLRTRSKVRKAKKEGLLGPVGNQCEWVRGFVHEVSVNEPGESHARLWRPCMRR